MKGWRDDLKHAAITLLVFLTLFVLCLCVAMANQAGFFAYTEELQHLYPSHEFVMTVEDTGKTLFTATENVSEALRDEIMGTVYPTPRAAMEAALGPVPGNPAYAHAVLKCTTRDGVVSQRTGGGDHLTYHRYDRNGNRFNKTYHRVYSHPAPVVTDTFFSKISKGYC